ncbi:unnamed protein product [Caenorhabditis nigoni]
MSRRSFRNILFLSLIGLWIHVALANPKLNERIQNPGYQFRGKEISNENPQVMAGAEVRVKRSAPVDLKNLLDRTSSLARIINGIYLQTGLINGTIKIDLAVSELLNFGSLTTADVAGFQKDFVTGFTTAIEEFKKNLLTTKEAENQKTLVLEMESIRKESESLTLENIGADDLFNSVVEISTKLDSNLMGILNTGVTEIQTKLDNLQSIQNDPKASDANQIFIQGFLGSVTSFQNYQQSINTFIEHIKSYSVLETLPSSLQSYNTLIQLLNRRLDLPDSTEPALQTNIQHLSKLLTLSKSADPTINLLFQLARSRSYPLESDRQVTSGFLFGVSDFQKLLKDIQDPWFEKIVGIGNVQKLVNGLKPLLSIEGEITKMDGNFQKFSKDVQLSEIQILQKRFQTMTITQKEAEDTLKVLQSPKPNPSTYKSAEDAIADITKLSSMVSSVRKWAEHLVGSEFTQAIADFDKDLIFTDRTNKDTSKNEIPKVMQNLKEKNSIEKFRDAINKAQGLLNGYNGQDIMKKAGDIKKDKLNGFTNLQIVKDEVAFYGNLQKHKDSITKLVDAIEVIQKIVIMKSEEIQTLEALAGTVSQASKDFQPDQLKSLSSDWNKEKNPDSQALLQIPGAMQVGKSIGNTVHGLQKVYDFRRSSVATQLESLEILVADVIQKLTDPEKTEIWKKWEGVDKEANALKSWNKKVDGVHAKSAISDNITEYGSLLSGYGNIGDVTISVDQKMGVLKDLLAIFQKDTTIQSKLKDGKDYLRTISHLDLHFSKYHSSFKNAPESFKNLDLFFAKVLHVMSSGAGSLLMSTTSVGITTNNDFLVGELTTMQFFLIIGVVSAAIIFGIAACVCYHRKGCFWAKRRARLESERESLMNHGSDQSTTATTDKPKQAELPKKEPAKAPALDDAPSKESKTKAASETKDVPKTAQKQPAPKKEEKVKEPDSVSNTTEVMEPSNEEPPRDTNMMNKNKMKTAIMGWVIDQNHKTPGEMLHSHINAMQFSYASMNSEMREKQSFEYLDRKKFRAPNILCNPAEEYRVQLMKNGERFAIHANWIVEGPVTFIPTQGPLGEEEGVKMEDGKPREYDDTKEDFWFMVWEQNSEIIVMLCNFMEAVNGVQKWKCGKYFNDNLNDCVVVTCGIFRIKTINETTENDFHSFKTRKLEVLNTLTNEKRIMTHYHTTQWPDGNVPNFEVQELYCLLKKVTTSKKPIVVHCSSGIGRTMLFIGMYVIAKQVERDPGMIQTAAIMRLRKRRWFAVQTIRQSFFLNVSVGYFLCKEWDLPMDVWNRQNDMFEELKEPRRCAPGVYYSRYEKEGGAPKYLKGWSRTPY